MEKSFNYKLLVLLSSSGIISVVSRSQTAFLAQGVIACCINAPLKKGLVWFTVLTCS